jgi:hypothetical protein
MSTTKSQLQSLLEAEIAANKHRIAMRDSGKYIAMAIAEGSLELIREKLCQRPDYLNYVISA